MKKMALITLIISSLFSCCSSVSFAESEKSKIEKITGLKPKIYLDFNSKTINKATITGALSYVKSYDGSSAIHMENPYSQNAEQYLTVDNINFLNRDYTLSFWYKGVEYGGLQSWARPNAGYSDWNGMGTVEVGGNIVSSADTHSKGGAGLTIMNLPYKFYCGYQISDGVHTVYDTNKLNKNRVLPNIPDSNWHNITVTMDRTNGKASFYVDGGNKITRDISSITGSTDINGGKLVFGADALGQYGIGSSNYDDIAIYDTVLTDDQIKQIGDYGNLAKLIQQVDNRLTKAKPGDYTSITDIEILNDALTAARVVLNSDNADYATAYNTLMNVLLDFAMGSNTPKQTIILSSDTHLHSKNDLNVNTYLKTLLNEAMSLPYKANTYINAGDYDETRITHESAIYFDFIKENFYDITENPVIITSQGNHQYTHPGNDNSDLDDPTGAVDISKFKEGVSNFIDLTLIPNKKLVDDNGNLKTAYYYMTDGNIHYIVTDQFEDSGTTLSTMVSPEQDAWFTETLDYCKADSKPIFVIGHYPLYKASSTMQQKMSQTNNLIFITGHTHYGFGRCGYSINGKVPQIELPATYWQRSESAYAGGGAYIGFLYEDSLVLRAYCTDSGEFLPEYDEIIYFEDIDNNTDHKKPTNSTGEESKHPANKDDKLNNDIDEPKTLFDKITVFFKNIITDIKDFFGDIKNFFINIFSKNEK